MYMLSIAYRTRGNAHVDEEAVQTTKKQVKFSAQLGTR